MRETNDGASPTAGARKENTTSTHDVVNTIILFLLGAALLRVWWLQELGEKGYLSSTWDDPKFGGTREMRIYRKERESDDEFARRIVRQSMFIKQQLEMVK